MQRTIERYSMYTKEIPTHKLEMDQHMQHLMIETENMFKKIEFLEVSKRKLLGQGLGSCSVEELQEIGSQLEQSLKNIRARKAQLFKEQTQQQKVKERMLLEDNKQLCERCVGSRKSWQEQLTQQRNAINDSAQNNQCSEVVTELSIGLPQNR
ncbi:hypothetical protein SLA2020_378940 [Shorea laevis]